MTSLTTLLDGLHHQLALLLHWNFKHRHHTSAHYAALLLHHFSSLSLITDRSLFYSSPTQDGQFFGALYNITEVLSVLILKSPTTQTVLAYCTALQDHLKLRAPDILQHGLRLLQLTQFIQIIIDRQRIENRWFAICECRLDLYHGEEKIARTLGLARSIVTRVYGAVMDMHHDMMHRVWMIGLYVRFMEAFRGEVIDPVSVYQETWHRRRVEAQSGYERGEKDVTVETYCKPAHGVSGWEECVICLTDIGMRSSASSIVVTRCSHFFHMDCLSSWVGSSGMNMSHRCPTCRTVLREPCQPLLFGLWNRGEITAAAPV
jgi:hypothetical protein